MTFIHTMRRFLWKLGVDISRYSPRCHLLARRVALLQKNEIDCLWDVGASFGQYGTQMRQMCSYEGTIISFEPLEQPYKVLKEKAGRDGKWLAQNYALGASDGQEEIGISANSCSSSILELLPKHIESAPDSVYVGKQKIELRKLDTIAEQLGRKEENYYLKIDAQGYGGDVLEGAKRTINKVKLLQIEMSIVPLYASEPTYGVLLEKILSMGFRLVSIEEGFFDKDSGEILQMDCIFERVREENCLLH